MLLRLVGYWLATALLALAVMTGLDRQEHARLAVRFADLAAAAVATDWAHGFDALMEPSRPIDTMPGLPGLITPLLDADLGATAVGLVLPGGQVVAARGAREALTRLVDVAAVQADSVRRDPLRPAPERMGALALDNSTRLLAVQLRDWTGTPRATLDLLYEAEFGETAFLWPWSWAQVVGTLVVGALLLAALGRFGWRSIDPLEQTWLPALLIVALIMGIGTVADSAAEANRTVTDHALSGIARRLSTATFRWSAESLQPTPIPLGDRVARIVQAVPGFDAIAVEAAPAAPRLPGRPAVAPYLVVTARGSGWSADWHRLLRIDLIALVASLAVAKVLPALLPQRWRRHAEETAHRRSTRPEPGGSREAGRACLFLVASAVAACWSALPAAASASQERLSGLGGAVACVAAAALAALLGTTLSHRITLRHGWRFAALPGAVCGLSGAIGLTRIEAGVLAIPWWTALGLGSGLAAWSLGLWAGRRIDSSPGRLGAEPGSWILGGVAGLALGLVIVLTANQDAAAPVLVLQWSCVVLAVAQRRNDSAAPLRHAVAGASVPPGSERSRAALLRSALLSLRLALMSNLHAFRA